MSGAQIRASGVRGVSDGSVEGIPGCACSWGRSAEGGAGSLLEVVGESDALAMSELWAYFAKEGEDLMLVALAALSANCIVVVHRVARSLT